jgi:hypothetical protein
MRKTELQDGALCAAVSEMERGLIDADLGGGVVKKRIALPGKGKSGSVRTIVATNRKSRWFFVFGFEKNDRSNITAKELEAFQILAADLLALSPNALDAMIEKQSLVEICHDSEA